MRGVCNERGCVLCKERMGASLINNYGSLAFYEKGTRNSLPRLLQVQEIMPAREAGKTVDNLNKRQAYMTKYQFLGSCDRAS